MSKESLRAAAAAAAAAVVAVVQHNDTRYSCALRQSIEANSQNENLFAIELCVFRDDNDVAVAVAVAGDAELMCLA